MRPQILLLTVFLAVLPLLAIPAIGRGFPDGAREPIKDVQDVHVRRAAQLVVLEFNKKNDTYLIFEDVARGKIQYPDLNNV
ncbi:hypothetical protein ACJRO7_017714 [Eucalyptus globulus]|uniref:Uncharacterized protein n=1 Tax=Eucalyptus globulus TaxID=34317 RepID=A0ABD3KSF3_EUCGL